jgi:Xaa-Pro dipeptidase
MSIAVPAAVALSPAEISRPVLEERIARVRAWMADEAIEALVIYGSPASRGSRTVTAGYVRYFTGWMTGSLPAMIVLPGAGTPTVVTMGPHDTRLFGAQAGWFGEIVAAGGVDRYVDVVAGAIAGHARVATLGVAEMPGPQARSLDDQLARCQVVAAEPAVDELRLRRHPEEVAMHRIGARISDAMIATAMRDAVTPGMSGPRLMADVEHTGSRLGAGTPSTWLAIGENPVTTYMEAAELAGSIGPNDRLQLGTSLTYGGHFAQTLRIGVRGTPARRMREYAQILVDIQDAALAVIRPGAMLHEVVDAIEAGIDAHCPYERDRDPFRFQPCHGLGLNYVEPGMARDLDPRRNKALDGDGVRMLENMVIEIHPNFTVPDLGHVCAGDMAVVTSTGAEWLSEFPRGLYEL